jgi:hypothetical protein
MDVGNASAGSAAAPTNVTPRLTAAVTRVDNNGSAGPAMLRLTSRTPESSAAASALASVKVLHTAASLSGFSCQQASKTSICASGAIPTIPM